MGERKSYNYLNKLKKKFNVDTIYSWSRYHRCCDDPFGYMLNYIKHIPETRKDSIWGVSGGNCHDILEDFYTGEIKYEDMIDRYEVALFDMNTSELKYDRSDKDKNETISKKYENSIRHFYKNYKPLSTKTIVEQFITIKVGRFYFQGYIDFLHKDLDGNYIIEDFKTSTIYTGTKKIAEQGQLVLYAESLIQRGIQLDNIKCRWNFLKYCTVTCDLVGVDKATGLNKTKDKNCVRCTWVKDSSANIKKWLIKEGYDELETEDMLQTCIENNSLDTLPKSIIDRFKISDCYVYVDLTQEVIDDLKEHIIETLDEIEVKTLRAKEIIEEIESNKDISNKSKIKLLEEELDKMFWTEIDKGEEYFFYNLSGYSRKQHKPWDEYLKEANMFSEDKWDNYINNIDNDLDWLNELL